MRQRADLVSVFLALRVKPWVWVLCWHATTTINSSLALGDDGIGPKRFAEHSTASILGTAATTWSTALARNVGGRKNLAERQELTGGRSHALVHSFRANFLLGKKPHRTVSSSMRRDTLTSFDLDCSACSSCCKAGPCLHLHATLGGVSKQILTIFFVFTPKDQWLFARGYLILGSITS